MTELKQLEADLGYVRAAVQRSSAAGSVASIHILWALIVPIGFALMDFAPSWSPLFWTFAGPGGFVLSGVLGWRAAIAGGQVDRAEGRRQGCHWGSMLLVILLAVPMAATGRIGDDELGMLITLVLALAYLLAGVHMYRPLMAVGAVLLLGYVGLWFLPAYRWTAIGVLGSVALVAAALAARPGERSDG